MKIALAQLNYHIGNFESNVSKIKQAIKTAKAEQADLVVFAELSICGYPPRDFLEFNDFITRCEENVLSIARECKEIAAIVGAPSLNPHPKGKRLYNSAFFLTEGKIEQLIHKTLLPNYDIFDEYRYFEPNHQFHIIPYKGYRFAVTICEDIWNSPTPFSENRTLYTLSPLDELKKQHPDVIINIAASPFSYQHAEERKKILSAHAKKYNVPVFYVNHVGSQTELIFDGGSMIVHPKGEIAKEMKYFEEDITVYDLQSEKKIQEPTLNLIQGKTQRIHDALVLGIKDYFSKMGFTKAIIGLSGGIDSAVTLVLAAKALGSENTKALLMPSRFSSTHSVQDAMQLCENIQCPYDTISIDSCYTNFSQLLQPFFKDLPFNVTEENMQARIRAVLLMAVSNKFGYILLNTSNKSEAAVGYGTLYGDMCGGLSVLGDVYKTEVYTLARYINNNKEIIPENTLIKAPSAELRPDQKDADSLPEYDLLDKILYQYIELRKGRKEMLTMGFDEKIVDKVLQLVNTNEYKRYQSPPILRVSPKAFGMGRRMPIVGKYL